MKQNVCFSYSGLQKYEYAHIQKVYHWEIIISTQIVCIRTSNVFNRRVKYKVTFRKGGDEENKSKERTIASIGKQMICWVVKCLIVLFHCLSICKKGKFWSIGVIELPKDPPLIRGQFDNEI